MNGNGRISCGLFVSDGAIASLIPVNEKPGVTLYSAGLITGRTTGMSRKHSPMIALVAIGAVVIAVSAIADSYLRDMKQARTAAVAGSKMAYTPCGPIEYAEAGTGKPVLVIHGAGGGFDQGMYFAKPLADRGFHVIAVSRFGYLRTPLPYDATPRAQADAYACLLDALGIKRVAAIVGASAGAPSTMQFALHYPKRTGQMVLVAPLAYGPKSDTDKPSEIARTTQFLFNTALKSDFIFWAGIELVPKMLTKAILATPPVLVQQANKAEQDRVEDMLRQILPVSERKQGLMNDAKVANTLERYDLEDIKVPTMIFSAKDDLYLTYEPARYTAEHIRGARFFGYEHGGHVWVGHHTELLSRIEDNLK